MVGLILDLGYERISNTVSVSSASKVSKMALLFAKNQMQNSFFQSYENFYFENFFGPNHGVPYSRHWILENV